MIYTPLTKRAMVIAYEAHHGQVAKSGLPYINHPLHLAETMDDETSCCVALLHDVAEDTDVTLDMLAREFPPEVIDALKKNSLETLLQPGPARDHMIEEMADTLMFFVDTMACMNVTADELSQAYREKHERNVKRWLKD